MCPGNLEVDTATTDFPVAISGRVVRGITPRLITLGIVMFFVHRLVFTRNTAVCLLIVKHSSNSQHRPSSMSVTPYEFKTYVKFCGRPYVDKDVCSCPLEIFSLT